MLWQTARRLPFSCSSSSPQRTKCRLLFQVSTVLGKQGEQTNPAVWLTGSQAPFQRQSPMALFAPGFPSIGVWYHEDLFWDFQGEEHSLQCEAKIFHFFFFFKEREYVNLSSRYVSKTLVVLDPEGTWENSCDVPLKRTYCNGFSEAIWWQYFSVIQVYHPLWDNCPLSLFRM